MENGDAGASLTFKNIKYLGTCAPAVDAYDSSAGHRT
jgi:hypothetical protein